VTSNRLLPAKCPACRVDLSLIIDDRSDPLMMQVWICPVCRAPHEAVFTRRIKQVTRPIDYPRKS